MAQNHQAVLLTDRKVSPLTTPPATQRPGDAPATSPRHLTHPGELHTLTGTQGSFPKACPSHLVRGPGSILDGPRQQQPTSAGSAFASEVCLTCPLNPASWDLPPSPLDHQALPSCHVPFYWCDASPHVPSSSPGSPTAALLTSGSTPFFIGGPAALCIEGQLAGPLPSPTGYQLHPRLQV